jgi:hypothetical protein
MGTVVLAGATSGSTTLSPTDAVTTIITLPASTDTLVGKATTDTLTNKTLTSPSISGAVMSTMASSVLTLGTAVASTSGTSIDFTGIPSWVKRITVMFNGVSTNGASYAQVQLGAGSVTTSGYLSAGAVCYGSNLIVQNSSTTGLIVSGGNASQTRVGHMTLTSFGSNIWVASSVICDTGASNNQGWSGGNITLGGTLDRVRITTVNGTDTFDAGSINIMYE